ncbi:hypothetical protein SLA2020_058150 [Shorea laevis]
MVSFLHERRCLILRIEPVEDNSGFLKEEMISALCIKLPRCWHTWRRGDCKTNGFKFSAFPFGFYVLVIKHLMA